MMHEKNRRAWLLFLVLCIVVIVTGMMLSAKTSYGQEATESSKADVTMMIYMNGSDLESSSGAGTNDMEEMALSGVDLARTNVLVYAGGSTKWHSDVPDDENVLFRLGEKGFEEVERFDDLSMGEASTLTGFLEYGHDHYPAETYHLILWNHGNGPVMGYGIDKRHNGDSLTLPELGDALNQSPFGKDHPLGIIGFDACLMASAELACTVSDYADYLVSSQETEPSFGWNYRFLSECGKKSSGDLAQSIVQDYVQYCDEFFADKEFFRSDVTLSVFDLSCAEELGDALDALFKKAEDDVSGDYNLLAAERIRTRALGRASTGSEYDLVDVESLMDQMSETYPQEAKRVYEALEKAVVFTKSNAEDCCGVSLFYPCFNKNYYKASWKEDYQSLGLFPSYLSYLERYDQIWLGTDFASVFTEGIKPEKGKNSSTYTLQLTKAQQEVYAQGTYYILRRTGEDVYYPVFISQDVTEKNGVLTASFDGRVLYGNDSEDETFKFIPYVRLVDKVGSQTEYLCPRANVMRGDIASDEFEWKRCTLLMSVDADTGETEVKSIYAVEKNEGDALLSETVEESGNNELGTGKQEAIDPGDWDDFMFIDLHGRYLKRNEDGRIISFWEWPEKGNFSLQTIPVNKLEFSYEPIIDDGYEYFVMFEIMDTQGNRSCSELLPITLADVSEEEDNRQEFLWKDDNPVVLIDEQGITLSLRRVDDINTGISYYAISAANNNDFEVYLTLEDFVYDRQYSAGDKILFSLQPGSEEFQMPPLFGYSASVSNLLAFKGMDDLEHLSFRLSEVMRAETGNIFLRNKAFSVSFEEGDEEGFRGAPILDALAGRQKLYEENGLCVELLFMGRQIDTEPASDSDGYDMVNTAMTADFLIQNRSGSSVEAGIRALRINGIEYSDRGGDEHVLQSGNKRYTSLSFEENELRNLNRGSYMYEESEKHLLRSVSEIEVLLSCGNQYYWLPVTLERKGTQDRIIPEENVVYEDGTFSIYASGIDGDTPEESMDTCLWYVNHSDRLLKCVCTSEEGDPEEDQDIISVFYIGPGSTIVRDEPAPRNEEKHYCIHWREEGKNTYTVSGPFSY